MKETYIKYNIVNVAPYNSNEHLLGFQKRTEDCCEWLKNEIELDIKGRIPEYIKHIKKYEKIRGHFGTEMYYFLHSINEMNQIILFCESLQDQKSKQFKGTVKDSIYGLKFRFDSVKKGDDKSRNYLFELTTASDYAKNNYTVDLSTRTDIIVESPFFSIECKRISSESQIQKRVEEAIDQIKLKEENKPHQGVIYIDITGLFENSHTIFISNETGFPFSIAPPSDNIEVIESIRHDINNHINDFLENQKEKLKKLLCKEVPCIVLNYDYVGFHISIINEDAIVGNYKVLLANDRDIDNPITAAVKSTFK